MQGEHDEDEELEDEFEDEESEETDDFEDEWPDGEEWAAEEEEDDEEFEEDDDDEFAPAELTRTLRFGLFAMAPLLTVYELALALGDAPRRVVSESLLVSPFAAIAGLSGVDTAIARRVVVGLALAVALFDSWRHVEAAGRRAMRVAAEGAIAALLLVPILRLVARTQVRVTAPSSADMGLADAAAAMGGAAYDELLFRILLLSVAFVGLRRLLGATGMRERPAATIGAAGAAIVAAIAYAAAPLEPIAAFAGAPGEAFDAGVFAWRVVAGLYLAGLLVLRGVGVAAWAHALHHLVTFLRT